MSDPDAAPHDYTDIASSKPRDTAPSTADVEQLMTDETSFAFALYQQQWGSDTTSNVVFSPYSISVALAMAYAGAAGETATQMATAMHFTLPPSRLDEAFDAVDLALSSRQGITLEVASSLWGQKTLTYGAPFLDTLAVDFGSEMRGVDFEQDPGQAVSAIDSWVSYETHGLIPSLLSPSAVTTETIVAIVNALYFTGPWSIPFDPSATAPRPFTRLDGSTVSVPTMTMAAPTYESTLNIAHAETYTAVQLPYGPEDTSMLIVMPVAFQSFASGLSGPALQSVIGNLHAAPAVVTMPKFTVQGSIDLEPALQSLGMVDAFERGIADFVPMVPSLPIGKVILTHVAHEANIAVDENGTQASAATAVVGVTPECSGCQPPSVPVVIDHPFFFFILDRATGTPLFAGRVLDPSP